MRGKQFGTYEQFRREILSHRGSGLASAVEDVADEMFRHDFTEEFDKLWDSADDDE